MRQTALLLSLPFLFYNFCHGLLGKHPSLQVPMVVPRGGASNHNTTPSDMKPKKKRKSQKSNSAASPKSPSSSPIVDEILKEEDYYKILGVSKDDLKQAKNIDREIQKAYRKRAVHTHPDKTGGDRRAFDKVAEAYEVLQDKDKRASYDRFGKEGMKQRQQFGGGASGMSAEDLFRSFFAARSQRMRQYILEVSLEELYTGTTKNIQLPEGETVECNIPRGMREGTALTAETASGESVVFVIRPRQHHLFTTQGADLVLTVRISLTEAITGVQRKITHLDGSSIHVVSAGDGSVPVIIETGDVQVLKGFGMPQDGTIGYGDLYIQYEVSAKRRKGALSDAEMAELKKLLSKLEGRTNVSKSNWPYKDNKKAKRLQAASTEDLRRSNPFGSGGFPFSSGFSPFGSGGTFFSQGF